MEGGWGIVYTVGYRATPLALSRPALTAQVSQTRCAHPAHQGCGAWSVQLEVQGLGARFYVHLRTMACWAAILRVPRAKHVVTTAGRPSGMAATARATAILK